MWTWPSGASVGSAKKWIGYTNWDNGEPNDNGVSADKGVFMNYWEYLGAEPPWQVTSEHLGRWHDGNGEALQLSYVCERPQGVMCPVAWTSFRQSCYWHSGEDLQTYAQAQASCGEEGAQLVTIMDQAENLRVQRLCGRKSCWIGLHRRQPPSQDWVWANDTSIGQVSAWKGYTNWDVGEPDNSAEEDAVFMNYWVWMTEEQPAIPSSPHHHHHGAVWTGGKIAMGVTIAMSTFYLVHLAFKRCCGPSRGGRAGARGANFGQALVGEELGGYSRGAD